MRLRKPLIALASIALSGALLTGLPVSPAAAAPGSSEYAAWTLSGNTGTVKVANVGGEGDFVATGANVSLASGSSAWLSENTPFGVVFGSSQGRPYLSTGIAAGSSTATVTYTFTDSGRVGTWGFTLGDVDAETLAIRATAPGGQALNVNDWFQGAFNYCAAYGTKPSTCSNSLATDVPRWDPATSTLIGSGSDTSGAAAWFRPNTAVATLTVEMTGLSGLPKYQTWMAADEDVTPPKYQVTVAARSCPTYTDIMANKARNNVMQSLQDLGVNSIYPSGTPVGPTIETDPATGQSACTPLEGWTVGFGNSFGAPEVGPWGSLTPVVNLNGTATTKASTPLLDSLGNPTGQTIAGATTMALSPTQTALIDGAGSLTAQGGVPGYPLNGSTNLAFGVLRCATDNVNGDNVEYVNFPTGTKHVFCYAYYVDETPAPGKITITKRVTGPSDGVSFRFGGNVSYNPGGAFTLKNAQSISFERQAGQTWTVTEDENAPYTLRDITCTGGSDVTTSVAGRKVDIVLGAGEDVRCIFENALVPQSSLEVYKVTENGVGTFGGDITGPGGYAQSWSATTAVPGDAVLGFDDTALFAGTYRVTETPETDWATGVACGYRDDTTIITARDFAIDVPIADGQAALCLFLNRLNIDGGITVRSTVVGGSGAVTADSQYRINPTSGITTGDVVVLTNTAWNTPESGSAPGPLALGAYLVQGNPPADTATNTWSVDSVTCTSGGTVVGTDANVLLDATNPNVTCDYVYRAEPINPVLTLTKTVTAGNDLRTGPVLIDVLCTTASGPFTSTVALPVGASSTTSTITLPTDTTSCKAVESNTGAPTAIDPGVISVTADGSAWPEGEIKSVPNGTPLAVNAISSTGQPVTQSVAGPCVESSAGVAPTTGSGTCTLTFTATGGAVTTSATWTAPGGTGTSSETSTFAVSAGGTYAVTFGNAYTGTETETTTTRVIEAAANPASLVVTKTVPQGNELRTGPVVVEVECAASALANPSAWPKTLTLDVSGTTATRTISVPGNASNSDVCVIRETNTGITDPGTGSIKPTWNGKRWKSTATKSLLIGDSATVKSTSSSGTPVTQSATSPCTLTGSTLTASGSGTCTVGFEAVGNPLVSVETTFPLGRAVVTVAGQTSRLDVVDRYTATPRKLTAKRTVTVTDTPPCPLDVSAAKSVSANGTTLLIKNATTGDGCGITDIEVTCPTARATPRGDYGCTVRREPGGRVYVTTYGNKDLTVTAKVVAKGPDHTKTTWTKTWSVS
jgi:hypothetical protein